MKLKPVSTTTSMMSASQKDGLTRLRESLVRNAKTLSWVLGAALVVSLVIFGKAFYQSSQEKKAATLYLEARRIDDFQKILEKYPSTGVAALSAYSLGSFFLNSKNWEPSERAFRLFVQKYPTHFLFPQAAMALAFSLEQNGKIAEAKGHYLQLQTSLHVS